ncbi:Lpg1974 family pore-forming outer membrane protein [Pantanalinema rosaneae CENA516]|uniref:Lpg1974 family pore-forming outer membrane protein n=1 Tax=Pantanalinema rosaneae TaxID=1620701 RepID=UPI003D6EF112
MKEHRLGLAVTLATVLSTSATIAHAQEAPELDRLPEADADLATPQSDLEPSEVVATPTIEQPTTLEFSAIIPDADQTEKVAYAAESPSEAIAAQSVASANAPVVVDVEEVVAPVPGSVTQPEATAKPTAEIAPQSMEMMRQPENTSQPMAASTSASQLGTIESAQPRSSTGMQFGTRSLGRVAQGTIEDDLQQRLLQLQQRQQQLEQQIDELKRQIPTANPEQVTVKTPENNSRSELKVFAGPVFLQPRLSDLMDYAIVDPAAPNTLATSGEVKQVELEDATAIRFGATFRPGGSAWDFGATFTQFETEGSSKAEAPTDGFLFSTQSHPFQNDTAETANAKADLDYSSTNVEIGHTFQIGRQLGVRVFGGVQAAAVDRTMTTELDGVDYTNGKIKLKNEFSGVGPRLGIEGRLLLGAGFSLFGRGAGSLMVGELSSSFNETDNDGADTVANIDYDRGGQLVPVLEAALGVDWEAALGKSAKLNISAGYEVQQMFNVTESIRFSDAASPGVFTREKGDLNLHGFFVKGGLSFEF